MIAAGLVMVGVVAVAAGMGPRRGRVPQPTGRRLARIERRLNQRLEAADLPLTLDRPVVVWMTALPMATGLGAIAGSWEGALVAAAATVAIPLLVLALRGDRSEAMLVVQLPALVDAVARQFRVGRSLFQAFDELRHEVDRPLSADLDRIVTRLERGASVPAEMNRWAGSRSIVDLRVVTTALTIGHVAGGARIGTLEAVGQSLRDKQAVVAELEGLTAQARASAFVVALAPLAFSLFLTVMGVAPAWSPTDPLLVLALGVGVALDLVGLWWMRRLTRLRW